MTDKDQTLKQAVAALRKEVLSQINWIVVVGSERDQVKLQKAVLAAVADMLEATDIIGEDEKFSLTDQTQFTETGDRKYVRNQLRAQQRQQLQKLIKELRR